MAFRNDRIFPKESVEDKTKKYTRPHPIVTSYLRTMHQSIYNSPPVNVTPFVRVPVASGLFIPQPIPYQHQLQNTQQVHQVISVQQQLIANRKRRYGAANTNKVYIDHSPQQKKKYQPPPSSNSNDTYDKISSEIQSYANSNCQSEDLLERKLKLRSALLSAFRREISGASLHLVGSSCNGFAGADSDADFCVMLTQSREIDQRFEACYYLRMLQKSLRSMKSIHKIVLIRAKVPILKFKDNISGCECDVNINNSIGIRNTHLLRSYSKVDDRVKPLVVVIKQWAKQRNINDASSGTLSSYSLVLLVIHYLQSGCTPPVLKSLQKEYSVHFSVDRDVDDLPMYEPTTYISCNNSENKDSLGKLFCGFFEYYVEKFRWDQDAASIRQGCKIPKSYLTEWSDKYIGIEEPFDRTNTARSVYRYDRFQLIKDEFERANNILKRTKYPNLLMVF